MLYDRYGIKKGAMVKTKLLLALIVLCFSVSSLNAMSTKSIKKIFSEKRDGYGYGFRRIGLGLFGSSSVGTNLIEYRFTPKISTVAGIGVEEGYNPLKTDKIKAALKYYILDTALTPYVVGGFIFREYLWDSEAKNTPYAGVAAQYLARNGLGVSFEVDYFRANDKNNIKPGFAIYWFF